VLGIVEQYDLGDVWIFFWKYQGAWLGSLTDVLLDAEFGTPEFIDLIPSESVVDTVAKARAHLKCRKQAQMLRDGKGVAKILSITLRPCGKVNDLEVVWVGEGAHALERLASL